MNQSNRYYRCLNQPILMMGIDKGLFFLLFGLSSTLAFSAQFHWISDIVGLLVFMITYGIARFMTRIDPQIWPVYKRYIRYQSYYPSFSSVEIASSLFYSMR